MGNWMFLVEHPLDELKFFGGFLTKLKVQLHKQERELANHERPYVLYYSAADVETDNKNYVSYSEMMRSVLEVSKFIGFNYRVMYQGRYSYNNVSFDAEFYGRLVNEIKLVRPKFMFIDSDRKFAPVAEFIEKRFPDINVLFSDNKGNGNYCNILKRDVFEYNDIDQLYKAYTLYGKLMQPAPSFNAWEWKYYKFAMDGIRFKEDFVETYYVNYFIDGKGLYDLSGVEFEKKKHGELNIEAIL